MIDASKMNVGDSVPFCEGEWNASKRELFSVINNFANSQEPRWQFQVERLEIGDKSHNPPNKDKYVLTRLR